MNDGDVDSGDDSDESRKSSSKLVSKVLPAKTPTRMTRKKLNIMYSELHDTFIEALIDIFDLDPEFTCLSDTTDVYFKRENIGMNIYEAANTFTIGRCEAKLEDIREAKEANREADSDI